MVALIGFGISANAQDRWPVNGIIDAKIDGNNISKGAEKRVSGRTISYVGAGIAILYDPQSSKAFVCYYKGRKFYVGETTVSFSSTSAGFSRVRINRGCNLYYVGEKASEYSSMDEISRILSSNGDWIYCSEFFVDF